MSKNVTYAPPLRGGGISDRKFGGGNNEFSIPPLAHGVRLSPLKGGTKGNIA
jgi:hypothetical protein